MATRGTAMLITNEEVLFGPEFNGDMAPKALGSRFMMDLSNVENNVEFIKMNNSFNKINHGYSNIMSRYQGKFKHDELKRDGENCLSMRKVYNELRITSDWIFIKNISNESIEIQVLDELEREFIVTIEPSETIRVYFGILY